MKSNLFPRPWLLMFLVSYLEGQLWTFMLLFKKLYSFNSYVYVWFISSSTLDVVLSYHCITLWCLTSGCPSVILWKKIPPSPCELSWHLCWKINWSLFIYLFRLLHLSVCLSYDLDITCFYIHCLNLILPPYFYYIIYSLHCCYLLMWISCTAQAPWRYDSIIFSFFLLLVVSRVT